MLTYYLVFSKKPRWNFESYHHKEMLHLRDIGISHGHYKMWTSIIMWFSHKCDFYVSLKVKKKKKVEKQNSVWETGEHWLKNPHDCWLHSGLVSRCFEKSPVFLMLSLSPLCNIYESTESGHQLNRLFMITQWSFKNTKQYLETSQCQAILWKSILVLEFISESFGLINFLEKSSKTP